MEAGCVGGDDIATLSNVPAFAPAQPMQPARAVPVAYSQASRAADAVGA